MPRKEKKGKRRAEGAAQDIHGVQGEGNREADRRYREGAKRFGESGRVPEAARDALDSLARDPGGGVPESRDEREQ